VIGASAFIIVVLEDDDVEIDDVRGGGWLADTEK